jgi:hypothetical protein
MQESINYGDIIDEHKNKIRYILIGYIITFLINFVLLCISASYTYTNHHITLFILVIFNCVVTITFFVLSTMNIRVVGFSTILLNAYTLKKSISKCIIYTYAKSVLNVILILICITMLSILLTNYDTADEIIISIYIYFLAISCIFIGVEQYIINSLKNILTYINIQYKDVNTNVFLE